MNQPCANCNLLPQFDTMLTRFTAHAAATSAAPSLRDAFRPDSPTPGLAQLAQPPALLSLSHADSAPHVVDLAMRYARPQPNCLAMGITNGVRGAVVGGIFGAVMGASSAAQGGYRGSAAVTYAGQNAARNAAGFAAWTSLYSFSRCGLIRLRQRNDIANSALAGAFTGGVLSLASVRGHWRFNQQLIMTNAAGSAVIAVLFDALNYI